MLLNRSALWLAALVALALLAPCRPAAASETDHDAALCERAIVNGARRGGVPSEILYAIALTETGRKSNDRIRPYPWAINREGKSHWFDTRAEALAFAEASLAVGRRSFDVGCVQINYRWHGHAFPSLDDMFDPEWTATYAAQFLRTLYEERGSWSEAAGAYHSLTPELASIYRARFDRLLAGLSPDALPEVMPQIAGPGPGLSRQERRHAARAAGREAQAARRLLAGPSPPAVNGAVGGGLFAPASGALLVEGGALLGSGGPLLTAPPGRLY